MSRNIMSIGRIMYSKMPTKRKLSDFYGFGLPSITENDQFTSSCTWKYQGSYSNQHGYIIKKKFEKSAPVSDLKSNN